MPILKWKKAEQQALKKLSANQWIGATPLLELDPMVAAPDTAAIRAASSKYIAAVGKEILTCIPVKQVIAIDTSFSCVSYGPQLHLLLHIYNRLSNEVSHSIIPTISAENTPLFITLNTAQLKTFAKIPEVILRIRTDTLQPSQIIPKIDDIAAYIDRSRIHVVLDQYSLVDRKANDCTANIIPYIQEALTSSVASVTVAGGSFPENLTGKPRGVSDIDRVEWKIWKKLLDAGYDGKIAYADYAVTNPIPLATITDAAKLNPSIAIRYTTTDFWRLYKGVQFKNVSNRGELRNLSSLLVTDSVYAGFDLSFGDTQYLNYSKGPDTNGSPWTWRRDATNHHIVFTLKELNSIGA